MLRDPATFTGASRWIRTTPNTLLLICLWPNWLRPAICNGTPLREVFGMKMSAEWQSVLTGKFTWWVPIRVQLLPHRKYGGPSSLPASHGLIELIIRIFFRRSLEILPANTDFPETRT